MRDTLWRGNRRLMHDLKLFVGMVVILSPYEPPLANDLFADPATGAEMRQRWPTHG